MRILKIAIEPESADSNPSISAEGQYRLLLQPTKLSDAYLGPIFGLELRYI